MRQDAYFTFSGSDIKILKNMRVNNSMEEIEKIEIIFVDRFRTKEALFSELKNDFRLLTWKYGLSELGFRNYIKDRLLEAGLTPETTEMRLK